MYVKCVSYENFRNYKNQTVNLYEGVNVFNGGNGQGKTNFIEGLYFASLGKSFKNIADRDLIKFGENSAEIKVDFDAYGYDENITVLLGEKKQVKINGVEIKKRSQLLGRLNVVLFTPQELSLVQEGPVYRRRFMDICAGSLRKKYLFALTNYNKVLEQKNRLLKNGGSSLFDTLDIWNMRLAEYASSVIWYRNSLINKIKIFLKPIYENISNEKISMAYIAPVSGEKLEDIKEIEKAFLKALEIKKNAEIEEQKCLIGPHRDDIVFYINGKKARIFGSQGQQRSIVLALKLVQARLFYEETGERPVLLLDDIASELDLNRRNFLLRSIKENQVIITCTDAEKFDFDAAVFNVEGGKIEG